MCGDTKIKNRFAWIPMYFNGDLYWLEQVCVKYEYRSLPCMFLVGYGGGKWIITSITTIRVNK